MRPSTDTRKSCAGGRAGRGRSWLDQEPGARALLRQVVRLYRRAMQRPLLVVLLALGAALAAVGVSVVRKNTFAPSVVLRAIEADTDYGVAPRAKRRLRDHVREAVFSSQRLQEIIRKHGLYPSLARKNPQAALASFKEDIEVDVYRNYFVEDRVAGDPPRSARIVVRYRSKDRGLALQVARELSALVAEHEFRSRTEQLALAARDATLQVSRSRAALIEARRSIAEKTLAMSTKPDPETSVELSNLQRSQVGLERRVSEAELRKAGLDLHVSLEAGRLGLRFEIADPGAIPESAGLHTRDLLELGALFFFLALPLAGLTVGAFDNRIRDVEDLRRLGIAVLGELRGAAAGPQPRAAGRREQVRVEGYA
jgi:hypothetical protein